MKIANANQLPKVYYGLHMVAGVAQYPEMQGAPTILIEEPALQNADRTAQGKPVYVHHVEQVDMANLELEMAGVWVRSFFNEADGAHWAEFTVQSDEGHAAIAKGYVLSNCYIPKTQTGPGEYHGLKYNNAVTVAEYEHLALTPTPRYQESIVLTPDAFKAYNEKKLSERLALKNSKGVAPMFEFIKIGKSKIENGIDAETFVNLPKSGKSVNVQKLLNEVDEKMEKEAKNEYAADLSHMVKMHDGKMCNVGELMDAHKKLNEEHQTLMKEHEEMKGKMPKEENGDEPMETLSDEETPSDDKEMMGKAKEIEEHEKKEIEEGEKKKNALLALAKMYTDKGLEVPAKLQNQLGVVEDHFKKMQNAQGAAFADAAAKEKLKNAAGATAPMTTADRVQKGREIA